MKKVYEWLDAGNGRVLLMRFLSRFHCALITAIAYAMVMNIIQGEGVELAVYCRGLLFFVPILLSFYAAKKLPALWHGGGLYRRGCALFLPWAVQAFRREGGICV